ncbi:MAG: hypothetical protein Q7R98_01570 [Candidatus Jorgensenbacteria bacterium]|nr:hypothetical protein [Candidatus Jorgensenbacteria bacterium]
MGEYKKFSEAEILIGGLVTFFIDFACGILDAFAIGIIVSPLIQAGVTAATWFWFKNKGDADSKKIGRQIAKYAANILPVIPTTFVVFVVSAIMHNRAAPHEKT